MRTVVRGPWRRLAWITVLVAPLALAGCGDDDQAGSTGNTRLDLSQAAPARFAAHASVEQLYVTDADAGAELELVSADGTILRSGTVDEEGTLLFRDLIPRARYAVASNGGMRLEASTVVTVMGRDDTALPSFYQQQEIGSGFRKGEVASGYGYIETRDGTKLAVNVILPGPPEDGPYPTVVEYSGYDPANPYAPQPSTLLAGALGYATVGVNMRGTGCSGGSFQYFETPQLTDGYDAIEVIAAQPWVKGHKVGMVGISYPGISQLFVAQLRPPHLAAIAPLSIISDTGRGILYPGGIINNGFAIDWTMDRQREALPYGQSWTHQRVADGDQVCVENQRMRGQTPDLLKLIYENAYYEPKTADPLAPLTFVDRINVPVFLAGAWQDEQTGGYFPTMLDHFTGTDKLHFTLTNGTHVDALGPAIFTRWIEFLSFYVAEDIPQLPTGARFILLGLASEIFGVSRVPVEANRFTDAASFEEALQRYEAEPRVRILFENGAGAGFQPGAPAPGFERSFERSPIPDVVPTVWYFAANGRLESTHSTGAGADSFTYDISAAQRTTIHGGDADVWRALPAWDWRPLEAGNAIAYATDPLPETLVMAGSGSVDLWVKSTAKDTDLQVTLSEIRPDGQEVYVQNGWLRASHRKVNPAASSELRPMQTHYRTDAADLPSGQFALARVELFPFAHVFRADSRLRISVEAPGGTRPRWKFGPLQFDEEVVNTVGRSAATPSRIVLPVVPDVEVTTSLPRCPSLRGQPCRTYEEFDNRAG